MLEIDWGALRARVVAYVRREQVQTRHVEDVAQKILLELWRSLQDGRFRLREDTQDPHAVLWLWVVGIAWRQVSNHRQRAYHWRERLQEPHDVDAIMDRSLPGSREDHFYRRHLGH